MAVQGQQLSPRIKRAVASALIEASRDVRLSNIEWQKEKEDDRSVESAG